MTNQDQVSERAL